MGAKKNTIILNSSGKKVNIDLSKITVIEFRIATKKGTDESESDKYVAKCCGMTLKELQSSPFPDYQQIIDEWLKCAINPVGDNKRLVLTQEQADKFDVEYGQMVEICKPDEKDPNSQSASTSD